MDLGISRLSFLKEYSRISEKYPGPCVNLQNLTIHVRKLKDESKESPKTEEEVEVRMINEISPEKTWPDVSETESTKSNSPLPK